MNSTKTDYGKTLHRKLELEQQRTPLKQITVKHYIENQREDNNEPH
jgi:hypothetical protein